MNFELAEEHKMLKDLVRKFVDSQLIPLESDVLARFGGEEFLVFLPQTSTEQAIQVAERLLAAVNALQVAVLGQSTQKLSISIGIANFGPDYDFAAQLKRADQALYRAKDLGRCRIEIAAE